MIEIILDFIEINWSAFVQHCNDHGIKMEEEAEKAWSSFKKFVDDFSFRFRARGK